MTIVQEGEQRSFKRCLESSPHCAPGAIWIALMDSRPTAEGEVLVNVRTMRSEAPDERALSGHIQELRLKRADGTWSVVEHHVTLSIN